MRTRSEWSERLKLLREKNRQPRILNPAKLSFKSEKSLSQTKIEVVSITFILQEMLKEGLQKENYIGQKLGFR